jgi:hypothetical protein
MATILRSQLNIPDQLHFILQYQENTQKFVHFPSIFALLLHALKRLLIEPNIYPKFCL